MISNSFPPTYSNLRMAESKSLAFPNHSWCWLVEPLETRFLLALLLVPTECNVFIEIAQR